MVEERETQRTAITPTTAMLCFLRVTLKPLWHWISSTPPPNFNANSLRLSMPTFPHSSLLSRQSPHTPPLSPVPSEEMVFATHSLFLLIIISSTIFNSHRVGANLDFRINPEGMVAEVSGEDNAGAEMLTKIRILLGWKASNLNIHSSLSSSPAPAPVEAALTRLAPIPPLRKHASPRSPVHDKPHIHRPEEINRGGAKGKTVKWIIIAVVLSVGAAISIVGTAVLLVCKWPRRNRKRTTTNSNSIYKSQFPSTASNKVSFDPGPHHMFYLNSLTPFLETNPNLEMSFDSKCKDNVNCSDEEIHPIESLSSDNESYHSACNSHCLSGLSSLEDNLDKISPNCSPFSCHSPRPDIEACSTTTTATNSKISIAKVETSPAFFTPMNSKISIRTVETSPESSSEITDSNISIPTVETSPTLSNLEFDSIRSGGSRYNNVPKISPSPTMIRNVNIPKPPPPPPRLPSVIEGGRASKSRVGTPFSVPLKLPSSQKGSNNSQPPPPPPPPSLPLKLPSSRVGFNSSLPPPPPLHLLQQNTPVGKDGAPLPKLKPLHWDKVRAAPDRNMVWDKIGSSSFELDEETIGSLFGYNLHNSVKNDEAKNKITSPSKHVLDHKRLQNVTILLKALNVTDEQVSDSLMKGGGLSVQQLEALVKMVPTKEEEGKISNYEGDKSELDPAEQFIKAILKIPFAFSRIEVMLYKETFEDEVVHLRKSFEMLKEACKELRSSRLFLRLLEAVLRTGNRMNVGTARGGARAFKLDALLKLSDVKGTDGKTTLLHFVVQEMIRSEGVNAVEKVSQTVESKMKPNVSSEDKEEYIRMMGLDLVAGLSTELSNVKKTASIDLDVLVTSVSNLSSGMGQLKKLVEVELLCSDDCSRSFVHSMKSFLNYGQRIIRELKDDEDQVLLHVREMTEYYHGDVSKDEANPLRIFVIVRDFLGMLDRVCKEVRSLKTGQNRTVISF